MLSGHKHARYAHRDGKKASAYLIAPHSPFLSSKSRGPSPHVPGTSCRQTGKRSKAASGLNDVGVFMAPLDH